MRLIDADKIHPDVRTQRGALAISQGQLAYAKTVNAIPIPDGATNRDVIKAMFGVEPRKNTCILPKDYCNGNPAECDGCKFNNWWNAPYKGGKEE